MAVPTQGGTKKGLGLESEDLIQGLPGGFLVGKIGTMLTLTSLSGLFQGVRSRL